MNVDRNIKKAEALKRMTALGLNPTAIEIFRNEDKVLQSNELQQAFYLYPNEIDRVREFEQEHNCLVYAIIRKAIFTNYLYVSDHQDEWESDMKDIESKSVFCYVFNETMPECSEFGYIGIENNLGMLQRIW